MALSCYNRALQKLMESSSSDSNSQIYSRPIILLLSNRSMCHLQLYESTHHQNHHADILTTYLQSCIEDVTQALHRFIQVKDDPMTTTSSSLLSIRLKLLYRRAKARYHLATVSHTTTATCSDIDSMIPLAIQDLIHLLQLEPYNQAALELMKTVQQLQTCIHQSKGGDTTTTPVGLALKQIQQIIVVVPPPSPHVSTSSSSSSNMDDYLTVVLPHLYTIINCLSEDTVYIANVIGRQVGIYPFLYIATTHPTTFIKKQENHNIDSVQYKAQMTSWHILSLLCSDTSFFQQYMIPIFKDNKNTTTTTSSKSLDMIQYLLSSLEQRIQQQMYSYTIQENDMEHWSIAAMGFLIRVILQLYQYDYYILSSTTSTSTTTTTVKNLQDNNDDDNLDTNPTWINPCSLCFTILSQQVTTSHHLKTHVQLSLAVLDLLHTWTVCDIDRIMEFNMVDPLTTKDTSSSLLTLKQKKIFLTPEQIHTMKPKDIATYQQQLYQIKEKMKQRSKTNIIYFCQNQGISILISCAVHTSSTLLEQTCISTISRLFSILFKEEKEEDDWERVLVPYLEPILFVKTNISSSSSSRFEIVNDKDDDDDVYDSKQQEANTVQQDILKRGLLTLALLQTSQDMGVWALSQEGIIDDLEECIQLNNQDSIKAQRIASQILSSAASMEKTRKLISTLVRTDTVQSLLQSSNEDIASNIASTFAKLGLADTKTCSDEGEIIALLQVGTQLLFQDPSSLSISPSLEKKNTSSISTTTSPSIQRGIEILSYVATKTLAKEELSHGYKGCTSSQSVIERLVEICTTLRSGTSSIDSYGIATIFSSLVVSNETLRKEAFQGKDITVEQYEALQNLGKTEEEKEWEKKRVDVDTPRAVRDRIQQLARKNVPRAMIHLLEKATDTTRDVVVTTLVRMAEEESVRGILVQQGVLKACIQVVSEVRRSDFVIFYP